MLTTGLKDDRQKGHCCGDPLLSVSMTTALVAEAHGGEVGTNWDGSGRPVGVHRCPDVLKRP